MEEVKGIYHTHSKYSKYNHGKDSVLDMVNKAEELGLSRNNRPWSKSLFWH